MEITKGQQLANALSPFITAPPKKADDVRAVVADIARAIDNAIATSEANDIVKELADLGIHSPAKDPVINRFNALVQKARSYMLNKI